MSESKFLSYILTEGILLLFLGLCMLILPKVSGLSFGFAVCLSFLIYGGYKVIAAVISRNISRHFILDIMTGLILFISGILLFMAPMFNIMIIIGLTGVFFILKSISTVALALQTRNILIPWKMPVMISFIELIFGLVIITMLPSAALWFAGVLAGTDFILYGVVLTNMYIATRYIKG